MAASRFRFQYMGNGERHQKSTLNKLTKKGRKEEFFLYLRFILANIDLKMQKSGKLLESFNLHIVANMLSEKKQKSTSQLQSSDIRSSNKQFAYFPVAKYMRAAE